MVLSFMRLVSSSQLAEISKLNPTSVTEIRAGGIHRKMWTFWQQGEGYLCDPKTNRRSAILWINAGESVFHLSYCQNGEKAQVLVSLSLDELPKAISDLRAAGF